MQENSQKTFEEKITRFLTILGRATGQMGLYRISHPSVQVSISEAHSLLQNLLAEIPAGELSIGVDQNKVLANGKVIFQFDRLPSAIKNTFNQLHLSSITFVSGIRKEELSSFCELSVLKAEHIPGGKPQEFLKNKGAEKILLNEAIYTKVVSRPGTPEAETAGPPEPSAPAPQAGLEAGTGGGGESGTAEGKGGPGELQELSGKDFKATVELLAARITPSPDGQKQLAQKLMDQFKIELEQQVSAATRQIQRGKKQAENVQVRTHAVLSNVADGIVVVDEAGNVMMMNPAAEQIFGRKLSDTTGRPVVDVIGTEKQMLALSSELSVPEDRDVSVNVSLHGDPDTSKILRSATAIIVSPDGKVVGTTSITPDESKYREVIAMQQEFISNVTHELRSPLTAIYATLGLLESATKDKLDPETRQFLKMAQANAERLNMLISDILDFTKMEAGKLSVHPAEEDPAKIAGEAIQGMSAWASSKSIRLSLVPPVNIPHIYADAKRTSQILVNLISNAIKFTPKTGSITVSLKKGEGNNSGFVVISVKDTGCGIKPEDRERIFEKFVQLAAGESRGGTGLGLPLTKALVIMQGGKMELDSEVGKGSDFKVLLPVYTGDNVEITPVPGTLKTETWWDKLFKKIK